MILSYAEDICILLLHIWGCVRNQMSSSTQSQMNRVSLCYIPLGRNAVKSLLQRLKKGQSFVCAQSHKTGPVTVSP